MTKNQAKEKVSVWADPEVRTLLVQGAAKAGQDLSPYVSNLLRGAVLGVEQPSGLDEIVRRMELLHQAQDRRLYRRLAALETHAVIEMGTTRRMLEQLLVRIMGVEQTRELRAESRARAISSLSAPTEELLEAIRAVMAEMAEPDESQED